MNAVGEWSPEVFARHLLECDWKQYQSVQPIHLLSSGSSVLAVVRWNGRLSSFVEACVLGSGEREICLKQTDYFVAVAEASLLLNNLSGVIVVMMALRSVAKLFKDAALAKSAKQGRWAYLCSLIEMNAEENQVFLGRFRTGEVVVPWVQVTRDSTFVFLFGFLKMVLLFLAFCGGFGDDLRGGSGDDDGRVAGGRRTCELSPQRVSIQGGAQLFAVPEARCRARDDGRESSSRGSCVGLARHVTRPTAAARRPGVCPDVQVEAAIPAFGRSSKRRAWEQRGCANAGQKKEQRRGQAR
jgi:hypothetical protein